MKILFVSSKTSGQFSPFVIEQAESIRKLGLKVEMFGIEKPGISGYLRTLPFYYKTINTYRPDLIHAHYGLSGLFANLQFKTPVITTFHGSDIHNKKVRYFSKLAFYLSAKSIFVSQELATLMTAQTPTIVPCGVDLDKFRPIEKKYARMKMGLRANRKYALFCSSFANKVKNPQLALSAIQLLKSKHIDLELIELKGFSREEVNFLLNAADVALLTSYTEGSPQFIKEAMACNCPIVATDVGDIRQIASSVEGIFLTRSTVESVLENLEKALLLGGRTTSREVVKMFDINLIAASINQIYETLIK